MPRTVRTGENAGRFVRGLATRRGASTMFPPSPTSRLLQPTAFKHEGRKTYSEPTAVLGKRGAIEKYQCPRSSEQRYLLPVNGVALSDSGGRQLRRSSLSHQISKSPLSSSAARSTQKRKQEGQKHKLFPVFGVFYPTRKEKGKS